LGLIWNKPNPHSTNYIQKSTLPQYVYNFEALNIVSAIKNNIVALANDMVQ
jgi:hypothetical protein